LQLSTSMPARARWHSSYPNTLRKRGFLVKTARGPYWLTFMGCVAVFLRHTSARL
jgi:hypothetical protein